MLLDFKQGREKVIKSFLLDFKQGREKVIKSFLLGFELVMES
jgi:hypothetical protein